LVEAEVFLRLLGDPSLTLIVLDGERPRVAEKLALRDALQLLGSLGTEAKVFVKREAVRSPLGPEALRKLGIEATVVEQGPYRYFIFPYGLNFKVLAEELRGEVAHEVPLPGFGGARIVYRERPVEVKEVPVEGKVDLEAVRAQAKREEIEEALGGLDFFVDLSGLDLSRDLREELKGASFEEMLAKLSTEREALIATLVKMCAEDLGCAQKIREYREYYAKRGATQGYFRDAFSTLRNSLKTALLKRIIGDHVKTVRVLGHPLKGQENYIIDGNTLYEASSLVATVVGVLTDMGLAGATLARDLSISFYPTPHQIRWEELNPWDKLNLKTGVLDLRDLRIKSGDGSLFTYRLRLEVTQDDVDSVLNGSYKVEESPIYRYWRSHFDNENWNYFVDSVGTWLSPFRFRHLAFLIGPRGIGKSTLLRVLTSPIEELVGHARLRSITSYTFGIEHLIGKQIIVYNEKIGVTLRNIDELNSLFGENDTVEVHRKNKPTVYIRSFKAGMWSMNDPPMVTEYGGETMMAFCDRLSIIHVQLPEGFKPIKGIESTVSPKDAFLFLLWARVQLEKRGWEIRKMSAEDVADYLMKNANNAYRFLESDYVVIGNEERAKGTELYEAYLAWCKESNVTPLPRNTFYAIIASQFQKYEREKQVWFKGIGLRRSTT